MSDVDFSAEDHERIRLKLQVFDAKLDDTIDDLQEMMVDDPESFQLILKTVRMPPHEVVAAIRSFVEIGENEALNRMMAWLVVLAGLGLDAAMTRLYAGVLQEESQ